MKADIVYVLFEDERRAEQVILLQVIIEKQSTADLATCVWVTPTLP